MTTDRPPFGQMLRRLRLSADLSQEQLADRARISKQAVSALERGVRCAPQEQTLALIVRALELDAADRADIESAARASKPARVRRTPHAASRPAIRESPLPFIATSFLGRDDDRSHVDALLAPGWCVTIWGSGGAGKTRLALETARAAATRFPDGIRFVELADVSAAADVARSIAAAAEVREEAGRPLVDSIVNGLRGQRALLIVDNAEHVIAECARIVERLVRDAPSLTLLCTSREPLHIGAERVYPLGSLPVPHIDDPALAQAPAVRLFLDRAESAGARIDATRELRSVATICDRLDAIPLALELAAARSPLMSPAQIVRGLDGDRADRLRLLTHGHRNAGSRQKTIAGVLDWSVALLGETERIVLHRLAVWPGKWTLDDALAVVCDGDIDRWTAIDAVSGLVQRSLVVATDAAIDERKYRLLQTTRTYALQRAELAGEADRCGRLQAERVRDHLTNDYAVHVRGNRARGSAIELSAVRAALHWSLSLGNDAGLGAEIAARAHWLWSERNAQQEGLAWIHTALAALPEPGAAAFEPLMSIARISRDLMQFGEAYDAASRALEIADRSGDTRMRADARLSLALSASVVDDAEHGRHVLEEALTMYERIGDQRKRLEVLNELAGIAMYERRFAVAREHALPLPAGFRAVGNLIMAASSESNLAEVEFSLGNTAEAIARASASLAALRDLHSSINVAITAHNLAGYHLEAGDIETSIRFARESLELSIDHGWAVHSAISIGHLAAALAANGDAHEAALLAGFIERRLSESGKDYRMETELRSHRRLMRELARAFAPEELASALRDGGELDDDAATSLALDASDAR